MVTAANSLSSQSSLTQQDVRQNGIAVTSGKNRSGFYVIVRDTFSGKLVNLRGHDAVQVQAIQQVAQEIIQNSPKRTQAIDANGFHMAKSNKPIAFSAGGKSGAKDPLLATKWQDLSDKVMGLRFKTEIIDERGTSLASSPSSSSRPSASPKREAFLRRRRRSRNNQQGIPRSRSLERYDSEDSIPVAKGSHILSEPESFKQRKVASKSKKPRPPRPVTPFVKPSHTLKSHASEIDTDEEPVQLSGASYEIGSSPHRDKSSPAKSSFEADRLEELSGSDRDDNFED